MTISDFVALASIGLNILVAVIGLTWGLAAVRDSTKEAVRVEIEDTQRHFDADIDNMGRSMGESIAAIREKTREVELFVRDTYLPIRAFDKTMELLSNDIKSQFARLDSRLERMEAKLDADR